MCHLTWYSNGQKQTQNFLAPEIALDFVRTLQRAVWMLAMPGGIVTRGRT